MNDLSDLKAYIEELRADRLAAKEKEKREAWTRYTAISVVFVAVLAAVATQWGGKYSTRTLTSLNEATLNQAKASDQWSFYQAKSIKQNLYELAHSDTPGADPSDASAAKQKDIAAKIARYEQEKAQIKLEAEKLEAERQKFREAASASSARGAGLGLAVSIFQIAIAIASISMIVKRKPFYYASLVLAFAATLQMAYALMAG